MSKKKGRSSDTLWTIWSSSKKLNETDTVKGIVEDLDRTKARLRDTGQRLNDATEQMFVPFEAVAKLFRRI
eukprot:16284342-Heterocapsa_arctica.AAC.1